MDQKHSWKKNTKNKNKSITPIIISSKGAIMKKTKINAFDVIVNYLKFKEYLT